MVITASPFLVGDRIECLAGLFDGGDFLDHRMGGHIGVEAPWPLRGRSHGPVRFASPGLKWAVALLSIQLANPSFSHRSSHQAMVTRLPNHWWAISCASVEKDSLARAGAGDFGVVQQDAFKGEDRTPIFHRAEKLALSRASDIVQLWAAGRGCRNSRYNRLDQFGRGIQCILAFRAIALAHHNADFGRVLPVW